MNHKTEHITLWSWKSACLTALIFAALVMVGCKSKPLVPTPPIPKGDAMIHVEFNDLSDDEFNHLTEFVKKLGESHSSIVVGTTSEGGVGVYNAYITWSDGAIDQIYTPNHPIPSPAVEASMKASVETYLKGKGMKGRDVKLELQYGL